jgi:Bacteriophage related domain of unknown function
MSVASLTQATDEILGLFRTAWEAGAPSQGLPVLYPDVAQDVPNTGAWARVTLLQTGGGQATLSGATGLRMFRYTGTVVVQVFTPTGEGQVLSQQLAHIVKNAYEGEATTPGDIWFRDARYGPSGQDGAWFRQDVLVDYEYEEVR